MRRRNGQQSCDDGQSDEGIVAVILEGKGSYQGQTSQGNTDAGQEIERRHVVRGPRQSTELNCNSARHWLYAFICGPASRKARLAAANPPSRKRVERPASSSCSQRSVLTSSASYHSGRSVVASPISAARSHVVRATVSLPPAICVNSCLCGCFKPLRGE